jgi:hypothetical protein
MTRSEPEVVAELVRLQALAKVDPEKAHERADMILAQFVRSLGYRDIARNYLAIPRIYYGYDPR